MTQSLSALGWTLVVATKVGGYALSAARARQGTRGRALLMGAVRTAAGAALTVPAFLGVVLVVPTVVGVLPEAWEGIVGWGLILTAVAGVRMIHWHAWDPWWATGAPGRGRFRRAVLRTCWSFALDAVIIALVLALPWTRSITSTSLQL